MIRNWKPTEDLASDALAHDQLADVLLTAVLELRAGSVVSVEGSWGRGKTDLLRRFDALVKRDLDLRIHGPALWVNPWKYARPDLLTPVIAQLIERIGRESVRDDAGLSAAARSIGRGLLRLSARALGTFVGGGPGGELASSAIDDYLSAADDAEVELDPVGALGEHFCALVDRALEDTQDDARLVVCVDDLDRCLPAQQVAMLEAIHFLTSTGARASFVVALDPWLAAEAIETHYKTGRFNTERYLEKIFRLRLRLRGLDSSDVAALVRSHLETRSMRGALGPWLGEELTAALPDIASKVLHVPILRNPRTVGRVIDRLYLLSLPSGRRQPGVKDSWQCSTLIAWLTISEVWPEARLAMQDAAHRWQEVWPLVCRHARGQTEPAHTGILARLPAEMPEFRQFIDYLHTSSKDWQGKKVDGNETMVAFREVDEALRNRGL